MLKTIIVDDEQPSINRLGKLLNDSGLVQIEGRFTEAYKALEYLAENEVDTVFLDIEMPDMDGIELASRIMDVQAGVFIVFVTAYNQYAVEAFRLNALDYLLKPVPYDRLIETLKRITDRKGVALTHGSLQVQCFGKFCASVGADEIRFRTEKAEELLALLIDSNGAFISRSTIIDYLWEDFDGDRALMHFNITLHYVKKALLPYGAIISIQYDRGSYRLDISNINSDYVKFCSFVNSTKTIGINNILEYEAIASIYIGEYLSGCDYEWVTGKRLRLLEQYIELILIISDYYSCTECYTRSIKWLREGLVHEPLHRELNYELIKALIHIHEHIIAAKHYELYKNGLEKKLGLEPDEKFKKLIK